MSVVSSKPAGGRAYRERLDQRSDSHEAVTVYLEKYLRPEMVLYDVGCGTKPFKDFLKDRVQKHIGIDIDDGFYAPEHIDLVGSADNLPVDAASGDAVLSSQVLEHLQDPVASIREAHRALKPGGYFFLSCPFLYPVHGIPYDFTRLTWYSLEKILAETGFKILEKKSIGGFWYVAGTFSLIYLKGVPGLQRLGLYRPAAWLTRTFFSLLHRIEGRMIAARGGDLATTRLAWVVTYVLVAQRPEAA
jgi:SAM-dependent methyltransferase